MEFKEVPCLLKKHCRFLVALGVFSTEFERAELMTFLRILQNLGLGNSTELGDQWYFKEFSRISGLSFI